MDHADAKGGGVVGVVDGHLLPVLSDLSALWLVEPEEYGHKGGFPRTVLSQQCMDFPLFQL